MNYFANMQNNLKNTIILNKFFESRISSIVISYLCYKCGNGIDC